jgi:hypothetical protein
MDSRLAPPPRRRGPGRPSMRRLRASFVLAAAMAAGIGGLAAGCEDGPNQPYSPAPPGAGRVWTAPATDAAVAAGSQGFDASYPTTGKTTLCSTDFKRDRWAWMLRQPVRPPRFYSGLDLAGGDLWSGLTLDDAESPPGSATADTGGLCQSVPMGAGGRCPSGIGTCDQNYWGNNQEVIVSWNIATHQLDQMEMHVGYTGAFETGPYPDHTGAQHSYSMTPGDVVRRDGIPFLIDWTGTPDAQITDIFNAAMASYASVGGIAWDTSSCTGDASCQNLEVCQCAHDPGHPGECLAGTQGQCGDADCSTDGYCLVNPAVWIFGIRPLAFYVVGQPGVPQPQLSTPTYFYNFWVKWEPFSNLAQSVELGPDGPVAAGTPVGAADPGTRCVQQIGQKFSDFRDHCVQVHGDAADPKGVDAVNLNKVLNGLTHDTEHWTANVMGINQNFTSMKVANDPDAVVLDTDRPEPDDLAEDFSFDLRARGLTYNDFNAQTRAPEFRASSLIFIEWAHLLLDDIAHQLGLVAPKTLGDKTCTGLDEATGVPNYTTTHGCSGVEGLIVPGDGKAGDFSRDPVFGKTWNPEDNWDRLGKWYGPVIRPGDLKGALCIDPVGQTECTSTVSPQNSASIWQNMLHHVTWVLGGGNVYALPAEMQDVRYYFKWFGVAFVKYLKAYGNYDHATRDRFPDGRPGGGLAPSDVDAQPIDLESLFFDYAITSSGQNQTAQAYDKFEYVDRDFIGRGAGGEHNWVPWDFEYGADPLIGNQRYDNWYRRMDRSEIALYSAMLADKSHTPGQENDVNVTNLAGSPLLKGTWPTYRCAIGQYGDPSAAKDNGCGGTHPPLDPTNPSHASSCAGGGGATGDGGAAACGGPQVCIHADSFEAGPLAVCAPRCDYGRYQATGCPPSQACVLDDASRAVAGCVDMKMDKNGPTGCTAAGKPVPCPAGTVVVPHPLLWYYPGAWSRTPFGLGHSPIVLSAADERPGIGAAKIRIPNFAGTGDTPGPYVESPLAPTMDQGAPTCRTGYALSDDHVWCNATLSSGTGTRAPYFTPLTPWLQVGGGETVNGGAVGFSIPEDGQRDQFLTTGQIDFTGVLESYVVDYVPYLDAVSPSCVATGTCNPGYACDPHSHACVTTDDTIRIEAVEGQDFLGQVFLCRDPATSDVLHVGMYDSAASLLGWLASHPGADSACSMIVRRSPYDVAVDQVTSKANGVKVTFGGGQGQGRVTDIILFDPNLIQSF